jgi:hypothetical protein
MLTSLAARIAVRAVLCCLVATRSIYLFQQWSNSELCGVIVGTGAGKAFCAGGDVASSWSIDHALGFPFTNMIVRRYRIRGE